MAEKEETKDVYVGPVSSTNVEKRKKGGKRTKIVHDGLTSPPEINTLQQARMLHERAPSLVKPRISRHKTKIRQAVQRIIRLLLMLVLRVLMLMLMLPHLRLHMKRGLLEPLGEPQRI